MASNVGQLQKHDSGQGSSKLQVTILAAEWSSSNGWISTIIRELAIQLAKFSGIEVTFFLPKCSAKDKEAATYHGISILEAKRRPGFSELDWLSFPPEDLLIHVVVGHGVKLGHQAQIICKSHKCKWFQIVDTDAEERGMFQSYENRTSEVEEEHKIEVDLCVMADFVVGIGPKLVEAFRTYLDCYQKSVFELTPGIFADFANVQRKHVKSKPCILVFGHGDTEDFKLKGFDIAARSVAALRDTQLMFVGGREKNHAVIVERLVKYDIRKSRLKVKVYVDSPEYLKRLFSEVDLVLMPSRTEPFGLTGLQALSAGVPLIVSKNSGFGEALARVTSGSLFVIDSEDPMDWTLAIEGILNKDRELQLNEVKTVQDSYGERHNWSKQCKDLFEEMVKCVDGTFSQPDIAAQAVGPRELKRNMKFTDLSPSVSPKRKRGIEKNKSEQPAETTQYKRKPKAALENSQQLVSPLANKRMDLTRVTLKRQEKVAFGRKLRKKHLEENLEETVENDVDEETTQCKRKPKAALENSQQLVSPLANKRMDLTRVTALKRQEKVAFRRKLRKKHLEENLEETVENDVDEGTERKPKKKRKKKKSKNKQKEKAQTS